MAPTSSCLIKICGITRARDAIYACELGVWALGFVFYPSSPRYITPERVGEIINTLRGHGIKPPLTVGVFVNASQEQIAQTAAISGIDIAQLHGDESIDFCKALTLPCIKAFRLADKSELEQVERFSPSVDYLLIDAFRKDVYGGSGHLANWSLASSLKNPGRLILAGGITPDNIKEAIRQVSPHAIDLSSGVEEAPGIKSHALMAKLFSQIG